MLSEPTCDGADSTPGRALITRYLHMTQLLSSHPSLARLAYIQLYPKIKNGTLDHQLYLRIMTELNTIVTTESNGMDVDGGGIVGEAMGVPDMEWVEETMETERKEVARLDVELRGYMSNLIKESIRVGSLFRLVFWSRAYAHSSPTSPLLNSLPSAETGTMPTRTMPRQESIARRRSTTSIWVWAYWRWVESALLTLLPLLFLLKRRG